VPIPTAAGVGEVEELVEVKIEIGLSFYTIAFVVVLRDGGRGREGAKG